MIYNSNSIQTKYEPWMREALRMAKHSPDLRTQNGAIIVWEYDNTQVYRLADGYNTFQGNVSHIQEPREEKLYRIEHAERMVIWNLMKILYTESWKDILPNQYDLSDGTLTMICPWASCSDCSRAIVGAGIKRLVRLEHREGETNGSWAKSCDVGDEIMLANNVDIIELPNDGRYGIEIIRRNKLHKF